MRSAAGDATDGGHRAQLYRLDFDKHDEPVLSAGRKGSTKKDQIEHGKFGFIMTRLDFTRMHIVGHRLYTNCQKEQKPVRNNPQNVEVYGLDRAVTSENISKRKRLVDPLIRKDPLSDSEFKDMLEKDGDIMEATEARRTCNTGPEYLPVSSSLLVHVRSCPDGYFFMISTDSEKNFKSVIDNCLGTA